MGGSGAAGGGVGGSGSGGTTGAGSAGGTGSGTGANGSAGSSGGASSGGGASAGGASGGSSASGGAGAAGGTGGSTSGGAGGVASGGTANGGAGSGGGAGAGTVAPPTRQEICEGGDEVVKVLDTRSDAPAYQCTGTIAKRLFDHAICTCETVSFAGYLHTSSFNSWNAPLAVASGAPVGVNTNFGAASYTDVGGTLEVAGSTVFGGFLEVGGDLFLGGDMILPGYLQVARDAWIAGNTATPAAVVIGRDYVYTPSTVTPLPFWSIIGGQRVVQSFTVPPPCQCAPEQLLDVNAIIEDGRLNNHNNDPGVNLSPTQFKNLLGINSYDLPCGRYYVDEISGLGSLTLHVDGRTALFVGGDVSIAGVLDVDLGPSGQLDLFIGGNLLQIGVGAFGDPNRPSSVRVFVGGDGDIVVVGVEPFNANLYAPRSDLVSAGAILVRGSVFVKNMISGSWTDVVYDRAVLELGEEPECAPEPPPGGEGTGGSGGATGGSGGATGGSGGATGGAGGATGGTGGTSNTGGTGNPPPPPQCTDACSGQCQGGQTCISQVCSSCVTDADCCGALVCRPNGTCGPLLL